MTDSETVDDPGVEYAWLIETSDDGVTWWQASHPVHGTQDSGGIEWASGAEELARHVLARRLVALRGDTAYDWEELWFRVTIWDIGSAVDVAGWQNPPHRLDRTDQSPQTYGRYLQVNHAEPHAVEVRTPRQVRATVWNTPAATS